MRLHRERQWRSFSFGRSRSRRVVARELLEETDQVVEVTDLLFVVENFFAHGQSTHHEVGLYFRARLPSESPLRDASRSHYGTEREAKLEYRWFLRSDLERLDLRPAFLREALSEPEIAFRHVVQRADNAA